MKTVTIKKQKYKFVPEKVNSLCAGCDNPILETGSVDCKYSRYCVDNKKILKKL